VVLVVLILVGLVGWYAFKVAVGPSLNPEFADPSFVVNAQAPYRLHYNTACTGWTQLMCLAMCRGARLDDFRELLARSTDAEINRPNGDGMTALMMAALKCHSESHPSIVRLLVRAGAHVNLQDNDGFSALMMLIECDDDLEDNNGYGRMQTAEMMRLLVEGGADLNLQTNDGYTALMLAASNGRCWTPVQIPGCKTMRDVPLSSNWSCSRPRHYDAIKKKRHWYD